MVRDEKGRGNGSNWMTGLNVERKRKRKRKNRKAAR